MDRPEFNLLTEPWIRLMREDCVIEELSLADALLNAHKYKGLAGELPTQNAAVLRLLLAVLHAVFERVDAEGNECELETEDDALDRWEELWKNGSFPKQPLRAYFEAQHENFWLFHPTRPFWQTPSAVIGTEYEASKLNGSISESSNKVRLFSIRAGDEKKRLTYPEAARWLLYVNAFDDTSAKPTKSGKADNGGKLPSPGAGWLGKIGFLCFTGDNLFETLMLNFVLTDDDEKPWSDSVPVWELEAPPTKERTQIPLPHDQAALLTLQSRRLILHRENGFATGYHLLGGDFFEKENALSEQMTVWSEIRDKKGDSKGYQPRRHDKERQMWRDFGSYAGRNQGSKKPGVIRWNALLQQNGILPANRLMCISISSVQYGDKDFFAADLFDDTLNVQLGILSDIGENYRTLILKEISRCDKIACHIGTLANELFYASGGDPEKKTLPADSARERYYYEIDIPFRKWLSSLRADDEDTDEKINLWRKQAKTIAFSLAEKIVSDAGPTAFVGKTVEKNGKKRFYSSSMAMQWFKYNMVKNI